MGLPCPKKMAGRISAIEVALSFDNDSEHTHEIKLALLRVEERPVAVASPEVAEDDHTSNCGVRTPQRGECVPLDLHHNQEDRQVCRAKDYHHLDLREKQRATGCNHIEQRNRCIVCGLIDVHDTVPLYVQ